MPVLLAKIRLPFCLLFLLFAAISATIPALAQNTITGQILDPSGASVAAAHVTLTDSQNHRILQATTDNKGLYTLSSIPPGTFTFTVEAHGFASFQQTAISIPNTHDLALNVQLKLPANSESVTVQADRPALLQVPSVGKTNTRLEDLPISIQIIDRAIVNAQGGIALKDTIRNSSGVVQGGSDGFGFGDKFQIRGLEARIYNDGFSDGDQRNGFLHSLNGVERIEILEGPASSLFGSGPPGGTINVVHHTPSFTRSYGGAFQTANFGLLSGNAFITGPTGLKTLAYRVDGLAQHQNGFRSLTSADYELRPTLSWTRGQHLVAFVLDARALQARPDPTGLIYVKGTPITGVSREAKYSTPFSLGNQTLARTLISDLWAPRPWLTVTNRFSAMYRNLAILRNGDGGTLTGSVLSGRQLRKQRDLLSDFDYEAEPVWSLKTGRLTHSLLTGFEAHHQDIVVKRATADLPSISDIFNPVPPETSTAGLTFLQDAKHSGFRDNLSANYFSLYATDQLDLNHKLKLRIGGRQDWWNTRLAPQVFVPGRIFNGTTLVEPPSIFKRDDAPFSWNVGAVYRILPGVSPFFGVARSHLVNFTSEATQNGIQAPESGLQYEAGIKVAALHDHILFTAAAFDVKRNNVFTLVLDTPVFNDQKTQGGEANIQLNLTRGWMLSANTTAQHAALVNNPSNPAATGKRPIGVPQHIFNLWTTYDLKRAGIKGLTIGGGLTNRDKMYGDILNTKSVPSYTTLDAVLNYSRDAWTASVGCRNLAGTRFFTAANGTGGFVGEPRSPFVTVRRTFGSAQ
jgi:iron complex outermembrane receptor protein